MTDDESDDSYSVMKQESDIENSMSVSVEAPTKEEAMEMFDEVWEDD